MTVLLATPTLCSFSMLMAPHICQLPFYGHVRAAPSVRAYNFRKQLATSGPIGCCTLLFAVGAQSSKTDIVSCYVAAAAARWQVVEFHQRQSSHLLTSLKLFHKVGPESSAFDQKGLKKLLSQLFLSRPLPRLPCQLIDRDQDNTSTLK